jgi:hypothetical protein
MIVTNKNKNNISVGDPSRNFNELSEASSPNLGAIAPRRRLARRSAISMTGVADA